MKESGESAFRTGCARLDVHESDAPLSTLRSSFIKLSPIRGRAHLNAYFATMTPGTAGWHKAADRVTPSID